jgi:hypothetical protein
MSDPTALFLGQCGCCGGGGRAVFAKKNFPGYCAWHPSCWGTFAEDVEPLCLLPDYYFNRRYLRKLVQIVWQAYDGDLGRYVTYNRQIDINLFRKNGVLSSVRVTELCDPDPIYTWDMTEAGVITVLDRLDPSGVNPAILCPEWAVPSGAFIVHQQHTVAQDHYVNDQYYYFDDPGTPDGKVHYTISIFLLNDVSLYDYKDDAQQLLDAVAFDDARFGTNASLFASWRGDQWKASVDPNDAGFNNIYVGPSPGPDITTPLVSGALQSDGSSWDFDDMPLPTSPDSWEKWLFKRCYGYSCGYPAGFCDGANINGIDGGVDSLKHSCPPPATYNLLNDQRENKWILQCKSRTAANVAAGQTCISERDEHEATEADPGNYYSGTEFCSLKLPPLQAGDVFGPGALSVFWGVMNFQKPDDKVRCCENEAPFEVCCTIP